MAGFRSYNAFLKSAKSQQGLSHKQAQNLYRLLRDRLPTGRPTRLTLRQHPRIVKQEISKVLRQPKAPKREVGRKTRERIPTPPVKVREPKKAIRSIEDYLDLLDLIEDYDVEVIAAGVDTGKAKKK